MAGTLVVDCTFARGYPHAPILCATVDLCCLPVVDQEIRDRGYLVLSVSEARARQVDEPYARVNVRGLFEVTAE